MPVAAIILAAGGSTRFGKPKPLATFRGASLVSHAVAAATGAECAPIVVVAGEHAKEIRLEVANSSALVVENTKWREGVGSSVGAGLERLQDQQIDAVVLLTCDQPLIDAGTIRSLIDLSARSGKPIVASAYSDTVGIPAFFHHSYFPQLLLLEGDRGAKSLIMSRLDEVAIFPFPEGAIDVDTPADYQALVDRG